MATLLNPYISFPGNAREAMETYQEIFGGDLAMNTFGEYGPPDMPGGDKIMHAMLTTETGLALMGADSPPGMEHNPGNNMSVSLSGEDAEELHGYWDKLAADGTVVMPLEKQMWGDEFGMCMDRFGTSWMVNITQPQS